MGNKEWDNYLREVLGDFKSEGGPADWEVVARQYDAENSSVSKAEFLEDEALKEKLNNYSPTTEVKGWDQIESALDAADAEFDQHVRTRIHSFQPPVDPNSWQAFLHSFSKHKILRAKLIAVKLFESAAVILLLITFLQMGHLGKIPLISTPEDELTISAYESTLSKAKKDALSSAQVVEPASENKPASSLKPNSSRTQENQIASTNLLKSIATSKKDNITAGNTSSNAASNIGLDSSSSYVDHTVKSEIESPISSPIVNAASISTAASATEPVNEAILISANVGENETTFNISDTYITESLSVLKPALHTATSNQIPTPVYVGVAKKAILEFGMLVQADYNQLKLPEDRLFNNGSQVIFPLQGLTSPGYGGGFTLALDHTRWALETGVIYNSKSFKPGREITVGDGSDNSNVEFDAMHMQLVSVPLQFRYRFEPKGRLKAYALAGFGLHIITQSDIDVMVEYNFPSLTPGENPKNNPSLARTIREAERVSDDFKEKAPFSTKSYISANLGLGLEYNIAERKTLFLQTAYQYQIPNLRFSNHDGKHLLSVSLQAGMRTPLGT